MAPSDNTISVVGSVGTALQLTEAELASNYQPVTETIDDAGQTITYTGVPVYTLIESASFESPAGKNGSLRDIIQASGTAGGPVVLSEGEIDPSFGGANSAETDIIAYEQGGTTIAPELIVPGDVNGGVGGRDIPVSTLNVETATVPTVGGAGGVTTEFTLGGDVASPANPYTVASVQAIGSVQQTDTFLAGATQESYTFTGAPLFTVVNDASITDSNILNDYVVAEGSDGYAVAYSIGEIDPAYRTAPDALVAYDDGTGTYPSIGNDDGDFRTTAPFDSKGGRYVSNLQTLSVGSAGPAACFAAGTRIATPDGDVPVEDLRIGGRVLTAAGEARPIRWIGRRSYAGRFLAANRHVLPILIREGALGDRVPRRDLVVSPNHAMYLDGGLIPAIGLVNGASIVQLESAERIAYFHIELETHDIILAEGAPTESFVDDDSRMLFHNAAEYHRLYPDAQDAPARSCVPRIENGEELQVVRRKLLARVTSGGQIATTRDQVTRCAGP